LAVKIRLKRMGRRKRPFYRIVAIDSRTRRDGPEIERLGWFDPLKTDIAIDLKEDRIIHWLEQGAQLSEKVNTIFSSTGLQYKLHLMREGKSEEEIAAALTEWQLGQEEKRARIAEKKLAKKKAKTPVADETAEDSPKETEKSAEVEAAPAEESDDVEETPVENEPEVEAEASGDSEETEETAEVEAAPAEESDDIEEAPVENEPEVEAEVSGDSGETVEENSDNESNDTASDDESKEESS
jgi:small subunit ribosomal protein S16